MKFDKAIVIGITAVISSSFFSLAFAEEIRYDSAARRDPMTPLVGPDGIIEVKFNPNDLRIEGIIFDSNRLGSLVLINGEFYKEGQSLKDSTIITIMKDRVILRQDDEDRTLWIREEVVGADKQSKSAEIAGPGHEKK